MQDFTWRPIGSVEASRREAVDDYWGGTHACVHLTDEFDPSALDGIDAFSHVEVFFFFDRVAPEKIVTAARHPRNNREWPAVGIFAQRAKNRPNRFGSTVARIVRRDGRRLYLAELDAIDGTPVVDIKPVMREFLPRGPVTQPVWSVELMSDYWAAPAEPKEPTG